MGSFTEFQPHVVSPRIYTLLYHTLALISMCVFCIHILYSTHIWYSELWDRRTRPIVINARAVSGMYFQVLRINYYYLHHKRSVISANTSAHATNCTRGRAVHFNAWWPHGFLPYTVSMYIPFRSYTTHIIKSRSISQRQFKALRS